MADTADDLGIPMKPARPVAAPMAVTAVGRATATVPPRVPEMAPRAAPEPTSAADAPQRRVTEPLGMPVTPPPVPAPPPPPPVARRESEARKLTVGREIALSGEIASCDTLVVEGSVEANLQNCRDVDIAESGLFKGSATIDNADVRGMFEGNLVVRKRLLIRAGGQVSGTIRYSQIEIEAGGQISGDVQVNPDSDVIAELPNARAVS
ncbi:MAG TPA: polymer-forming cytoskeletal protein [Stellaceae bacterium]|nr:polymer-forming cytoskeletal protein [Stellaceae bacterium]